MKKLLLTLALTLFASTAMAADFIKIHKVFKDKTTKEITINVENIYKVEAFSNTSSPTVKAVITFSFIKQNSNVDLYVSETKAQIEAWLNIKN